MKKLVLLSFIAFLTACGNKVVFEENHPFPNDIWQRFEAQEYKIDITDNDVPYCLTLTLRYDTSRFNPVELPLVVDFFMDSTELHNITAAIRLKGRNGKLRGETIDQYCTVIDTIDRFRMFNKCGTYTYRIKQRTSKYEIAGLTSLTLKVEKAIK